jgi:hypothetical protein
MNELAPICLSSLESSQRPVNKRENAGRSARAGFKVALSALQRERAVERRVRSKKHEQATKHATAGLTTPGAAESTDDSSCNLVL